MTALPPHIKAKKLSLMCFNNLPIVNKIDRCGFMRKILGMRLVNSCVRQPL